ncbi:MAG: hypothetical protein D6744_15635 [Planctomycetota bacterium]|nr:MAG: hypothetical protein D6744_15635 [Planctomycetota bacterium]
MTPWKKAGAILRYMGPGFVLRRMRLALRSRLGGDARVYRPRPWDSIALEDILAPGAPADAPAYAEFKRRQAPPFLFPLGRPPTITDDCGDHHPHRTPTLSERLRLLREDRCVLFFRTPTPGPVDWYDNPLTGGRGDAQRTWIELPDFSPEQGDIRTLWEASRCAWAIDIARARARDLSGADGDLLWRWVDSWMAACPPYKGTQWKCGQEASVRLIALAIGFWATCDKRCGPERWLRFARLCWATGYRVANQLEYAVSQRNNHALSEAAGLMLVSQLFPEFRDAARWRARARRIFERQMRVQCYADGAYIQHSMNYQRVMLHDALLILRLAQLAGEPFGREIEDHVARSVDFLYQLTEAENGHTPNYGNNDGACVLPLSECEFADFRPVLQAANRLLRGAPLFDAGPWDEESIWLLGDNAPPCAEAAPPPRRSSRFDAGGYYTLRRRTSWAMFRCHTYRDRPGQYDTLHTDLWWRGQNVCCDAGTHQYYTPKQPPLAQYFRSHAAHNVVEPHGPSPFEPVSPFLWFPWSRAKLTRFDAGEAGAAVVEGETFDYDRPPWRLVLRRSIISIDDDLWIVVDDLIGAERRAATLRWHLADFSTRCDATNCRAELHTPRGVLHLSTWQPDATVRRFQIVRGVDDQRVQGWIDRCYAHREPVPVLEVEFEGRLPLRIVTVFSAAPATITGPEHGVGVWRVDTAPNSVEFELGELQRTDKGGSGFLRVFAASQRES